MGVIHTNSNLEKFIFKNKIFNIQWHWRFFLSFAVLLLAIFSGLLLGAGGLFSIALLIQYSQPIHGALVLLSLLVSLFIISQKGFPLGVIVGIASLTPFLLLSTILPKNETGIDIGTSFFTGAGSIVLVASGIAMTGLSMTLAAVVIESLPVAAVSVFIPTLLMAAATMRTFKAMPIVLAMPIILVAVMLAWHLSWKTVKGNQAFRWMLQIAIAIAAKGGHTFRGANLTDADFTGATLKLCDLRGANLKRTRLFEAKGLEFSRLGNTYLANPKIRQLVVTLNGQAQNFDGLNLEGVNLQDGKLQDASFIGANLNHANLRNADLSRAILKQAQLDGADLTGAILTGACIEDWGITGTTKLEGVQCDYVFMRLETKDNPNRLRKPDNWRETFADREFSDFIKPYVDTLDLYHSQDIDPRAISIALKNLAANHPDEKLMLVAIERRGSNGLNLRFTTAPGANKSELSHEYFTDYARIKKELPIAVQLRLAEQDAEIRTLKGTIEQFIEAGTHQSKIQAETIQVIQGELVVTENNGINITSGGGSIGDISGLVGGDVSGVVNLGTISGNVTNTINQLPDASEPDQPNLKELLTQLQQAIENDSDLSDPDKADLLEQVQVLAEAKQTEEPAKKEGLARKARKMFDATLSSLPQTASIVEACSKLLPMVLKALGLSA